MERCINVLKGFLELNIYPAYALKLKSVRVKTVSRKLMLGQAVTEEEITEVEQVLEKFKEMYKDTTSTSRLHTRESQLLKRAIQLYERNSKKESTRG